MKKVVFVCMALLLALVGTGVAYAMWSDTLVLTGVVKTGSVDVDFVDQVPLDPSPHGTPGNPGGYLTGSMDPNQLGDWWCANMEPFDWWDPLVIDNKNVASTDCEIDPIGGDWLKVTVDNAYPGYYGSVMFTIKNNGSIPVKLLSLELLSLSQNGVTYNPFSVDTQTEGPIPMEIHTQGVDSFTWLWVDNEPYPGEDYVQVWSVLNGDDAYGITLDGGGCGFFPGSQIEPGESVKGVIDIRVVQPALQGQTYDFTIGIKFAQWNEVP